MKRINIKKGRRVEAMILVAVVVLSLMGCSIENEVTTENAHIPGKYVHQFSEEIGGEVIEGEDVIILNEDHSCEMTFQDTVFGEWTDNKILTNGAGEEEYIVEGDILYLNMDGIWVEFVRSN